jgi:hypothetical protein
MKDERGISTDFVHNPVEKAADGDSKELSDPYF